LESEPSAHTAPQPSRARKRSKRDSTPQAGRQHEQAPSDAIQSKPKRRKQTARRASNDAEGDQKASKASQRAKGARKSDDPKAEPNRKVKTAIAAADGDQWSKTENKALRRVYMEVNPTERNFWRAVSKKLKGRSAKECMAQFDRLNETPPKKKPAGKVAPRAAATGRDGSTRQDAPADGPAARLATKGTMKRTQQTRAMLEAADREHDDDIFGDATATQGNNDWDEESPQAPVGEATTPQCDEAMEMESPGILKKVDRSKMDPYIHQLKHRGQKKTDIRKNNTGATKRKKASVATKVVVDVLPSPDDFNGDAQGESFFHDEDQGYYWSDADG